MRVALIAAALVAMSGAAAGGTIGGTIREQAGGAALASAEVRLWTLGVKGWSIAQTTASNASGDYSFTFTGNCLIDVRGPVGSGSNYGDRWYDVAAPASGGYVGANADIVAVGAAASVGGIDISLEILGGADGTVVHSGSVAAPSMWVRMERRGEVRIHHNDLTKSLPTGLVSMRGMVPASDYQIIAYDPTGVRDTLLAPGPYGISSGNNGNLGTLGMADAPADPNEGNNTANCGQAGINGTLLHMDPPQPWVSTGARIGPLANSDVDWYCFTAVAGDRLIITTSTEFTFSGATRRHPWTDPMISFWRGARVTRLVENDDFGGNFDARVDTGPLTAGCHCAAVSTFGDTNFVGAGQNSTGAYQLRAAQGNRPPVPSIKKGTTEVPAAPATFSIDEGDTLVLDLDYTDADHDVPTKSFTHEDNAMAAVAGGTLVLGANNGSYTWTAPPTAATGSPYTLRLQAGDGEFQMTKTVILVVNAVNMAPPAPLPVSPIGGAVVMTGAPSLVWMNAPDPEGNVVRYDVEVYLDDTSGAPAQSISDVVETAAQTMWVPSTIAENTRVFWRVRARDLGGALSPWSDYAAFLVDSANDPPEIPILIKPAQQETVAMRRPGLSVLNVEDPEDDAVEFEFVIARDAAFVDVVWTSPGVPQSLVSGTTMTSTGVDLPWGGEYFARVRARDARGGLSEWSDSHRFRLKSNAPPTDPAFEGSCVATTYDQESPTEIVVRNVDDPEGEVVMFELEMYRYDDVPASSFPVYTTSAVMSSTGTTTAIPIDLSALDNGRYRYFVHAFDGTDSSGSIECELTLDLPAGGGQPGGCCQGGPASAGLLGLLTGLGLLVLGHRRRRRLPV